MARSHSGTNNSSPLKACTPKYFDDVAAGRASVGYFSVCAGQTGSGVSGITSCSTNDGWITSHDGCLFIGVVSKNWTESRVNCKARGSDLASFPSNVHDQVLLDKLRSCT